MGVAVLAVARSGTLDYALKLLCYSGYIKWLVVVDHHQCGIDVKRVRFARACRRNSLMAPFLIARTVRRLRVRVILLQYEYSMLGKPLLSHALLLLSLLFLKMLRIRVVVTLHGVLTPARLGCPEAFRRPLTLLVTAFYTVLARVSDRIVVLNGVQQRLLSGLAPSVLGKIRVIPHGALLPEELGVKPGPRGGNLTLFFHGFLRPSKGLDLLVEALRILRERGYDVSLRALCSIPYVTLERREEREYLRTVLEKLRGVRGVSVRVGYFDDEEIVAEALSSDIVVLPYLDRYYESSGVLHKLMGCGKPIVITPTPRFLSDLEPPSDCFVAAPHPESLAGAIVRLVKDGSLALRLGGAARRKAEERRWRIVAKKYAAVLLELAREAKLSSGARR